jgi:aminoglycoside phosphotransferase (APT) family kinase protein
MDIHPDNVILTQRGPVVIDWTNAGAGAPGAEVADLWLLMSIATVPGDGIKPKLLAYGRRLFLRTFMRHFDREDARKYLRATGDWRISDRNMLDAERERIRRFVEKWAT